MTLEEAIQAALAAVAQFYGNVPSDIRLEEIMVPEHTPTGSWEITVGFLMPKKNPALFPALTQVPDRERVYKKLRFDSQTGEFIGMENRLTV